MTTPRDDGSLKEAIAREVRKARAGLGVSQHEVADRAGLTPTYISEIENARRNPSATTIIRLSYALGVDPNTILGGYEPSTDARYGS